MYVLDFALVMFKINAVLFHWHSRIEQQGRPGQNNNEY